MKRPQRLYHVADVLPEYPPTDEQINAVDPAAFYAALVLDLGNLASLVERGPATLFRHRIAGQLRHAAALATEISVRP